MLLVVSESWQVEYARIKIFVTRHDGRLPTEIPHEARKLN
jgi:hypothetical protein